jgi:hypothetical protein
MTVIAFRPRPTVAPLPSRRTDPRNGEVYASASIRTTYVDGQELETLDGFMWIHMSRSGDSAYSENGFETLAEAEAGARQRALKTGAVFVPSIEGGTANA